MPVIEIATLEAYTDATILKPIPGHKLRKGPTVASMLSVSP